MCEVLPIDQAKQSSYSLTDIESTPSSLDFCAAEDEMVSFQCGEPVELQDPCPISLTEEDSPSAFILEEKRNIYTPSKKNEHKREKPPEFCPNSCDLMHRECSAPVLCSDTQVASLSEQGISFEDISPFGKQELSSLTARSGGCSLTPDIILSPCGPSSSESSSSKPSSFSAFSRLAQKLSQDYLYGASAHVAHRCNTVSDELSLVPFQRGESVSISTSYSPRRFTSWYYSLTASYKTKLDQFRRIFRGTPVDTDRLLVDYSCALSKNNHGLLLQGRMYVTENWICFYSKILYEQKIYLAVKEIIGITKEKTARVIPNAIQIMYSKNHERFFFTSFASRERTFAILRKVWENCRNHQVFLQANQTMSIEEIMQQVREIYGDDSLAMLEDEDTDADPDLIQSSSAGRFGNISESSDFYSPLESGNGEQQPASTDAWQSDRGLSDNGFSEPRVRSSADDADDDEHRTDSAPIERPHSALEEPHRVVFFCSG
ncbi:GRAM domain-containing protein 1B [Fasciola gigantica]|uniref:GRAM domain-containing protein 1B n=1 Tax=Fasciola gigantica TaxID=46835 RepID=A0A504YR51_FASGI|nr:GRAM domain-containing protein 1B [Fasciola gigantica]